MIKSLSTVTENRMGKLKVAKTFGVPGTTVQRLVETDHLSVDQAVQIKLGFRIGECKVKNALEMKPNFTV
nr:unnamed protein product [Callosobruchus chinensis]